MTTLPIVLIALIVLQSFAHISCFRRSDNEASKAAKLGIRNANQSSNATDDNDLPDEKWDYIEVRPGAHMFWWFHGYIGGKKPRHQIPLVLFMNGGPGDSSVGLGSFYQIGPIQMNLSPRHNTWLKKVNLLFIDYPVGVGFSYANYPSAYSRTDLQAGQDLYKVVIDVMNKIKTLQNVPFYFVGESYGGKVGAILGSELIQGIKKNQLKCNFRGGILSSPFVSPVDTAESYGNFLYAMSLVAHRDKKIIDQLANRARMLFTQNKLTQATNEFYKMMYTMLEVTSYVNIYYVRTFFPFNIFTSLVNSTNDDNDNSNNNPSEMYKTMNGPIRDKLGIIPKNVTFADSNSAVGSNLHDSFMTDVISKVDDMLDYNVSVMVVNGQFDGIVNGLSNEEWIEKLKWNELSNFLSTKRTKIMHASGKLAGFIQKYKNLAYCTILDTGHSPTRQIPDSAMEPFAAATHGN